MKQAGSLQDYASYCWHTGKVTVLHHCIRSLTRWCQWHMLSQEMSRNRVSIHAQHSGVLLHTTDADTAELAMTGPKTESSVSAAILMMNLKSGSVKSARAAGCVIVTDTSSNQATAAMQQGPLADTHGESATG